MVDIRLCAWVHGACGAIVWVLFLTCDSFFTRFTPCKDLLVRPSPTISPKDGDFLDLGISLWDRKLAVRGESGDGESLDGQYVEVARRYCPYGLLMGGGDEHVIYAIGDIARRASSAATSGVEERR